MSRIEKKSSEPSFTVATTSHELRGDYSKAAADFTIQQDWSQYTEAEHALWRKLYARQAALMPKYAAKAVQQSLDDLCAQCLALASIMCQSSATTRYSRASGYRGRSWSRWPFFSGRLD